MKWNHFQLPHTLIPDGNVYELLVYADDKDEYFFFGNALLWCLGHAEPHLSLSTLVPIGERHTMPLNHAIYLSEVTAGRLIADKANRDPRYEPFERWFRSYLSTCRGKNPSPDCPRGPDPGP